MTKDSQTTESALQEISACRAESIGVSGFAECLCQGPNSCPYALPFGYAFLCRHPRMDEIIETTKKERLAAAKSN
jgi:hypothetical protein